MEQKLLRRAHEWSERYTNKNGLLQFHWCFFYFKYSNIRVETQSDMRGWKKNSILIYMEIFHNFFYGAVVMSSCERLHACFSTLVSMIFRLF